jgi:peptidoglycan hydrolase-like protein with peptidoglycan-binding domain
MNTFKIGSRGNKVIQIQLLLNGHLSPLIKIKNDGHFGKNTERAVMAFQRKTGLEPDGIVGPETWRALGAKHITVSKGDYTQSTLGAPWYDIALAEMGVKEILGADKNSRRIIEYHSTTTLGAKTDEVPWCSSFVNWVIKQSGFQGTNNALAKSWSTWGTEVKTPQKGDICRWSY